jgi:site-specific DNA recombinase
MTITSKIKNLGILLRISREAGEGKDTLLSHRTIAERYCNERGYKFKIYEEIISGGKDISERTELTKLLNDVTSGLWDAVFVVSTDRLSRKLGASQEIADTLAEYEVPLLTPERSYDLNSNDRLMFDIEGVMASQELRLIKDRQKRGKREGLLRGEWIQGLPPFGFTRNPKTKKLVSEENEAKIVRMIFDYALAGYGIATIVNKLAGYRTRSYEVKGGKNAGTIHQGKPFGISQVNTILKNPVYKGTISYQVKNKPKQVIEPPIIVHNAHECIVTPEEFQQAQEAVKSRISGGSDGLAKRTRSKGQVITILKDLVYCHCGLKMQFKKDSKQKDTVYLKGCSCGNKGIAEQKLLISFWDELSNIEGYYRKEWDKLLNDVDSTNNIEDLCNQLNTLKSRKEKLTQKAKRIRNSYHDGDITRDEYHEDKAEVEKDLSEINTTIQDLEERIELSNKDTLSKQYETKLKWLSDIRELSDIYNGKLFVMGKDLKNAFSPKVEAKDFEEVNRLLKLVIDKVQYHRYNDETNLYQDGFVDIEKGDFVRVTVTPK